MKKCLIAILMMVALLSTAAMADLTATAPVNIHLTAGTLEIAGVENYLTFPDTNIADIHAQGDAYVAHSNHEPTFYVKDYTGDGLGWHVNLKCTTLTNQTLSGKTLDVNYGNAGSTLLTKYDGMDPVTGQGPMKEAVTRANANIVDYVSIAKANAGYGMGKYHLDTIDSDFEIPIPSSKAFAGEYTGTATFTLVQGPGGTGSWSGHIE